MPAARFLPGSVPRGPRHGLRPCDFCGERSEGFAPWATAVRSLTGCRRRGWGRRLPSGTHSGRATDGHVITPPPAEPQRHRVSPDGLPRKGLGPAVASGHALRPGRGRTSFAGAASRTTDEAHNDSPTRRAAASPGKLRRAASSGPRADALLLPSSEPRANGFSGLPRLPGHPIGLRPGIHSGWTDRRRTRNYAPPPGRRRGTRNYFPACRACSAPRSSRTRRGMPTAERSRMWVSGLRIHAVSGLPGSTR